MSEVTAEITLTVICYDCTPGEAAARMAARMPGDPAWYVIGDGEFEITGARVGP
jgi:hypothetical protein